MNFIDLTGQKIGKWNILYHIQSSRKGHYKWYCRCECGLEKQVWGGHLRNGKSTGCHQCANPKGNLHKQWNGTGEISGNFWDSISRGANGKKGRRQPLDFTITKEYAWTLFLQQNRLCALSKLPLIINFARKTGPEHTASLDRIDSSIGYIEGNVQWIHKDINMMKRTYHQEYFIKMCKYIADNN